MKAHNLDICTLSIVDEINWKLYVSCGKGVLESEDRRDHSSPYFPCRYLRRLVVAWMCHNRYMIWKLKRVSLESKYGVEGGDVCAHPISFKDYLRKLLTRSMWGDDVVLYSLSCIYDLKITVLNAHTMDEYRYRHNQPLASADMVLILMGGNHYLYAG